jgi:hypothetical protein
MFVVVRHIARQHHLQLTPAEDQHPIQHLTTNRAHPPFRERVRPRARTGVRRIWTPSEPKTASKLSVNLASRSRMRNLNCPTRSPRSMSRLRACCATHHPVGFDITPRMWTWRLATSSATARTGAGAAPCRRGRSRTPGCPRPGRTGTAARSTRTARCRLDAGLSEEQPHGARGHPYPSCTSSPWTRRYPHVGFSAAIRRIRRRNSCDLDGRPGGVRLGPVTLDEFSMPAQRRVGGRQGDGICTPWGGVGSTPRGWPGLTRWDVVW